MRVQVKDLLPNPFRMMERYPLNRTKIETLKQSISETSFWDNLLARPAPKRHGKYEISFGHHRLAGLKELGIKEIDIPIRDLDDATMFRIMASENSTEWGATPAVTTETIRAARNFLKEHPKAIPAISRETVEGMRRHYSTIAMQIEEFLHWPVEHIRRILVNLDAVEDGTIAEEVLSLLPTHEHITAFRVATEIATKKLGLKPLSKLAQVHIAEEIHGKEAEGDKEGTVQSVKKKVIQAHVEQSAVKSDPHLAEKWITQDRIDKLTKSITRNAEKLLELKNAKYFRESQVVEVTSAIVAFLNAVKEVMGNVPKI